MGEEEKTYRLKQMEYTHAVRSYALTCDGAIISVAAQIAARRVLEAASDALADATVALVKASK